MRKVSITHPLQQLQKAFKGKLQIVTISTEKEKRVKQFLHNKPSNLWFAVDSADVFCKQFPYHTIPHSVLINDRGIVVAITQPGNITAKVIDSVIAGRQLHLPFKEDNMVADPWTAYFPADATTQSQFIVQPKIDGASSGSKSYGNDSVFKNRRISMTIDLTPKENVLENKKMCWRIRKCTALILSPGVRKKSCCQLYKTIKSKVRDAGQRGKATKAGLRFNHRRLG